MVYHIQLHTVLLQALENIMKDNSYGDDTGIIYVQSYVHMYYTALLL